jgi:hypothetical protein
VYLTSASALISAIRCALASSRSTCCPGHCRPAACRAGDTTTAAPSCAAPAVFLILPMDMLRQTTAQSPAQQWLAIKVVRRGRVNRRAFAQWLHTKSSGLLPAFVSQRCRANQLASGIIWGNDGQRQIRSGEDDRSVEPRPRRCKKSYPESEGHRHVCKANTEKEKTCSEKEPSSSAEISQF